MFSRDVTELFLHVSNRVKLRQQRCKVAIKKMGLIYRVLLVRNLL